MSSGLQRYRHSLGSDVAFFNCGLGWARASDAAANESWLSRVSEYDTVIVAFGTNDIVSGKYRGKEKHCGRDRGLP